MALIEETMFRQYDIRGMVNEKELNETSAELIGKGFAALLQKHGIKDCVAGYDARSYSEKFKNAFVKGLLGSGINVIDLGMVPVPVCYFAQFHFKVRGIAMITASHNPNGWSGFKLGYDYASTLLPDDVKELLQIVQKEEFVQGKGSARKADAVQPYTKDVLKRVQIKKKLKLVLNCRNGTPGKIAPEILRKAGCTVIEQYCDIDFSFPHGDPNPSLEEMMQELGKKVVAEKADLGLAIDGDGDRLGMCDESGNNIYPDRILIMLARNTLQQKPGAKIVFDVKTTQALPDDIKAHNGIPIMWKTGHSYIKEKVHSEKAALGGERSGHIFFLEGYYGFDDAIFAALKVVGYVSSTGKSVSQIVETFPKYYSSPVIHAPCPDEVKYDVEKRLVADLKKRYPNVIDINGARVIFPDGWGLVRASSNLPVLVLVFEARSRERLKEIEEIFREELAKYKEISKKWANG